MYREALNSGICRAIPDDDCFVHAVASLFSVASLFLPQYQSYRRIGNHAVVFFAALYRSERPVAFRRIQNATAKPAIRSRDSSVTVNTAGAAVNSADYIITVGFAEPVGSLSIILQVDPTLF